MIRKVCLTLVYIWWDDLYVKSSVIFVSESRKVFWNHHDSLFSPVDGKLRWTLGLTLRSGHRLKASWIDLTIKRLIGKIIPYRTSPNMNILGLFILFLETFAVPVFHQNELITRVSRSANQIKRNPCAKYLWRNHQWFITIASATVFRLLTIGENFKHACLC